MLTFSVRKWKDHVVVGYECACGCRPMAHLKQSDEQPAHEHCCCGNVHFAGPDAMSGLKSYLAERKAQGMDDGVEYTLSSAQLDSPWGRPIPVAYAMPVAAS